MELPAAEDGNIDQNITKAVSSVQRVENHSYVSRADRD